MNPDGASAPAPRKLWLRALLMILMGLAFHVAAWLLLCVALLQLLVALVTDQPNPRLRSFGRSLGRYLLQIGEFVSFETEEPPFPFNDWPGSP